MGITLRGTICLALLLAALLAGCAGPVRTEPAAAPRTTPPSSAAVEVGAIADAPYRIEVPDGWSGDLVVYLHGYEGVGWSREGRTDQDDFDRWLLGKGHAVARSEYSRQGWAVAEALVDTEAMRQRFVALHGKPRRTYLIGHSMGGHLVLATLEKHGEHYDGGLALCGANAPSAELFNEGLFPPVIAFDHFFPDALGLAPGGLADPASPDVADPDAIEAALRGDEARAQLLAQRFDIPRDGLAGGLMIRYIVLRELMQRAGGFPLDNRDVQYDGLGDDDAFNADVRRYAGNPAAMAYAATHAKLTGHAPKPVVLLANHADPTIPTAFSSRYVALAAAVGNADQVIELPRTGTGHCAFAPDAVDAAFETLQRWVGEGKRPELLPQP